jgi:hypothetical protein
MVFMARVSPDTFIYFVIKYRDQFSLFRNGLIFHKFAYYYAGVQGA